MNPTLVLLAAGMSTRYGRLKQLEPLGPSGEALLDYAVFDAFRAGFSRVVLIIREELEEAFRDHITGRWPVGLEVAFHHQRLDDLPGVGDGPDDKPLDPGLLASRTKPWGTAHALLSARLLLPEPFALLNADDFYGASAFQRAASLLERGMPEDRSGLPAFCLVGFTLEDTLSDHGGVSRAVCTVDSRGELGGIQEVVQIRRERGAILGSSVDGEDLILGGNERVSTNFWILTPDIFPALEAGLREFVEGLDPGGEAEPEFLIPQEINRMIEEGLAKVRVHPSGDPFLGITHPEDRDWVVKNLAAMVEEGLYPESLWGEG